jgi:hypothetical protein
MDFRGRSSQEPGTPAARTVSQPAGSTFTGSTSAPTSQKQTRKLFKIGSVILLFSVTALVIALTFLLVFSGNSQAKAVKAGSYQAVFLNNGQVYFGNIKAIGNKTFDLQNIYYLQTNGGADTATQTTASTNVSLVKLGCELHAPVDQMLINSDQVIFWENIKDSGQVVKAIADYKKQNPQGTCSQQSQSSTQQAPSTTPATTTPTTTTPTTTTPTTTKKP